jgi:hypothetical protein
MSKKKTEKSVGLNSEGTGSGEAGGGNIVSAKGFKVSKISLFSSRKFNMGNFNMLEVNAGLEIVFPEPKDTTDNEVKQAYNEAIRLTRETIKENAMSVLHAKTKKEEVKEEPKAV